MSSSGTLGGGHAGSLGGKLGLCGLAPTLRSLSRAEGAQAQVGCAASPRQAGSVASTEPRPFLT